MKTGGSARSDVLSTYRSAFAPITFRMPPPAPPVVWCEAHHDVHVARVDCVDPQPDERYAARQSQRLATEVRRHGRVS